MASTAGFAASGVPRRLHDRWKRAGAPPRDPGGAFVRDGVAFRMVEFGGEDVPWVVYAGGDGDVLVDKRDGGGLVRPRKTWNDGYLMVSVRRTDGRYVQRRVHDLVARAFLGPPPSPEHIVDHVNGNPEQNDIRNLRWATQQENRQNRTRHMRRHRRSTRGRTRMLPVAVGAVADVQQRTGLKGRRLYRWVDRVLKKSVRTMKYAR